MYFIFASKKKKKKNVHQCRLLNFLNMHVVQLYDFICLHGSDRTKSVIFRAMKSYAVLLDISEWKHCVILEQHIAITIHISIPTVGESSGDKVECNLIHRIMPLIETCHFATKSLCMGKVEENLIPQGLDTDMGLRVLSIFSTCCGGEFSHIHADTV